MSADSKNPRLQAWVLASDGELLLVAYIDEVGQTGAFVSHDHPKYNTSAGFGYAGFLLPESEVRAFGSTFTYKKRQVFKTLFERAKNKSEWEVKGSDVFRKHTPEKFPQYIRVFNGLVQDLVKKHRGCLFYYVEEKLLGTPKQTHLDEERRERDAMRETLNRLCTEADRQNQRLIVLLDGIDEKQREARIPKMYGHIYSRAQERDEMRRIIEPPMHVDSKLSANIQFADWVAEAVGRGVDRQLVRNSDYHWAASEWGKPLRGSFTHESKLRLWQGHGLEDINHADLFNNDRPIFPYAQGHLLGESVPPEVYRKILGRSTHHQ